MALINLILPSNLHLKVEVIGAQSEDIKKVLELLIDNNLKITNLMATIEEVQQALADLQTSVDAKQAAIAAAIAALEAQIAAGSTATPEQLQAIVDGLKSVQADVDSTPTA